MLWYIQYKRTNWICKGSDRQSNLCYLADVFNIAAYHGNGLSKWLIETIHAHPELQSLRRWMLGPRDAHEIYKKFGWTHLPEPERLMQKHNPNAYQPKWKSLQFLWR